MNIRLMRPLVLLLVGVVMFQLVNLAARPVSDPDAWWHLRLGDELWETGWRWAHVSHWSSFATEEFVPSAPLSELLVAKVDDWGGLPGLAWIFGACMVSLVVCLHLLHRQFASDVPAALATALAVAGASDSFTPRPQMLSFVFIVVIAMAWFATERDLKPRWWLIPLTWVWGMLHGYWLVGVLIGFVFVIGLVMSRRLDRSATMRLFAVPAVSMVSVALTPLGPSLLLAPFAVGERNLFVEEGARTAFDRAQPWIVLLMIVAIAVIWVLKRESASWARIGLLVMSLGWLVVTERTVAVAALLVAPLLAASLQTVLSEASSRHRGLVRFDVGGLAILSVVGLAGLAVAVPHTSEEPGDVPSAFNDRLAAQPDGATILNHYDIGGWLAWRHSNLNVAIDPSILPYPTEYISDYAAALDGDAGWRAFVDSTDAVVAALRPDNGLTTKLTQDGWTEVGADEGYILLERP